MGSSIVVIDDSRTVCKILEVCLGRQGHKVRSFQDSVRAVQELGASQVEMPDLILVDIEMPKMDGYAVIRYLRSRSIFRSVPFVIISRHDGLIDRLKGKLVGCTDYVIKPFRVETISSVVESHLSNVALTI